MSRPLPDDQAIPIPDPLEQVRTFAELLRPTLSSDAHRHMTARTRELGLTFTADELTVVAALDTPDKVQHFLNAQIYYNDDHATADSVETAMPPRRVLQTARAHCFEGACFAYTVNYLHGHGPKWVLLEGSQDSDHNLVLFRDPGTGLLGVNAHSAYPHLDGRRAEFQSLRAIAESFFPYYYSDISMDTSDLTLMGYSDPFDLVARYGVAWMGSEAPLWDLYYTYVDGTVRLRYLFDDSGTTHTYPLIEALENGWILVKDGNALLCLENLPVRAAELWPAFFAAFQPEITKVPRGLARRLEMQFFALTGTTPLDLQLNVREVQAFLDAGYRVEQLVTKT